MVKFAGMKTKNIVQKVITSGALIRDNKILIVQRASDDETFAGLWELPGGKKEPLESVINSVKRELKEEVGLDIEVLTPVNVFNWSTEKREEVRDATEIIFLVKQENAEIKISSEHSDFKWITEAEIENFNISKETTESIKKAFQHNKNDH